MTTESSNWKDTMMTTFRPYFAMLNALGLEAGEVTTELRQAMLLRAAEMTTGKKIASPDDPAFNSTVVKLWGEEILPEIWTTITDSDYEPAEHYLTPSMVFKEEHFKDGVPDPPEAASILKEYENPGGVGVPDYDPCYCGYYEGSASMAACTCATTESGLHGMQPEAEKPEEPEPEAEKPEEPEAEKPEEPEPEAEKPEEPEAEKPEEPEPEAEKPEEPEPEPMACFCGYERGDDAEWQAHISHCPKYKHKMDAEKPEWVSAAEAIDGLSAMDVIFADPPYATDSRHGLLCWPWYVEMLKLSEESEGLMDLPDVLIKMFNNGHLKTKQDLLDTVLLALFGEIGTDGVRKISALFEQLE